MRIGRAILCALAALAFAAGANISLGQLAAGSRIQPFEPGP